MQAIREWGPPGSDPKRLGPARTAPLAMKRSLRRDRPRLRQPTSLLTSALSPPAHLTHPLTHAPTERQQPPPPHPNPQPHPTPPLPAAAPQLHQGELTQGVDVRALMLYEPGALGQAAARVGAAATAAGTAPAGAVDRGTASVMSRAPQKYLIQNQSGMKVYYWADAKVSGGGGFISGG